MHLSKRVLYIAIIGYAVALLIFQDWPAMVNSSGSVSAMWLGKMFIDILFAGMGFLRLVGPAFFADEDDDDDVTIHADDLQFSDTALFGLFMANILANGGFHAYQTVMLEGSLSFYFSLWTIAEAIMLFFAGILFSHARKSQRKLARKSREAAAKAAAAQQTPAANDPKPFRRERDVA
jgi:hypothetical protein